MSTARAYAANDSKSPLGPHSIPRREVGATDVEFDILYCGVCHSDLHAVRGEWASWPTIYPCVPGHEIVGKVTKVGANVKGVIGFAVGRTVFWEPLKAFKENKLTREQATDQIAKTYSSLCKLWMDERSA